MLLRGADLPQALERPNRNNFPSEDTEAWGCQNPHPQSHPRAQVRLPVIAASQQAPPLGQASACPAMEGALVHKGSQNKCPRRGA